MLHVVPSLDVLRLLLNNKRVLSQFSLTFSHMHESGYIVTNNCSSGQLGEGQGHLCDSPMSPQGHR